MQPDDLYGLALNEFIPARGALAKALRAGKRRDEAAQVAALRKPSVAAWAVNQLVRTQGDAVRELFGAGDGLREAQADLLAGRGDGRTLRAANERERAAVDALVEAARGLLSSEGHELSAAVVERVADTLHAAALDAGAREQVRDGRLVRELRHAGLGLGESPGPAPAPAPATAKPTLKSKLDKPAAPAKPAKAGKPTGKKADPGPAREEAAEARRTAREQAKREKAEREQAERERAEARNAARTAEVAARRRAERAGHALKAAEERRARAAHALEQADEALAAAQSEAQAAVDAQRAAQTEFEQLS